MDRLSLEGSWLVNLAFAVNVAGGNADEFTVGSIWGPGIIESVRFARLAADVAIRAFILPGRVPLRESVGSEAEIVAPMVIAGIGDVSLRARVTDIYSQTAEETEMRIGVVVPWEFWSLMIRLENPGGVGRDLYGHFVVRVLAQSVLPVAAFWEREAARHMQVSQLRGVS